MGEGPFFITRLGENILLTNADLICPNDYGTGVVSATVLAFDSARRWHASRGCSSARRASLIFGSICSKSIFNLRKAAALYSELEAKIILSFICIEVSPFTLNRPLSMIATLLVSSFLR